VRDRVALITGGAAGIGLAVARNLHGRGATVALVDVDQQALGAAAAALGTTRVHTIVADVRDRDGMADAVAELVASAGGLDLVVANAGVTPTPATLRSGDRADFDRVLDINLHGVLNTVQPALDALVERGGHAVVVASVAAFTPTPGGAAYNVSKAAAEALGRCLRLEMAPHGVSVQVAYFGVVDTAMTHGTIDEDPLGQELERMLPGPLRRRITPEEAAASLVDGIQRRAARTMAPGVWQPYALLRGVANIAVDAISARDPRLRRIVLEIESRTEAITDAR